MTQQYLLGELSLILGELQTVATNQAAVRDVARLRREAETRPLAALLSVAARALELTDRYHFTFGAIDIDGVTYEHDLVIDRVEIHEDGEHQLTPPAVANDRVLVGTWDGRVVSLDASSGRVRWEVGVGAPCHWTPVMVGAVCSWA